MNNNGGRVTGRFLSVSNNNLERSSSLKSNSNGAGSHLLQLTSSLRASMRSKLSHASNLLLYGEESRAAKVTVFVLLALAFCWVPYFSMILVNLFMDNGPHSELKNTEKSLFSQDNVLFASKAKINVF